MSHPSPYVLQIHRKLPFTTIIIILYQQKEQQNDIIEGQGVKRIALLNFQYIYIR